MATFESSGIPQDDPLDPLDDEATIELPPRRRLSRTTALLAAAVVGGGMFVAGAAAERHWGSPGDSAAASSRSAGSAFASRLAAAGAATATTPGRVGFGGFAAGGVTIGTVSLIKGTTLYVTDTSGNTVKVTTGPGARVTKTVTSSVRGIDPGQTVVVRGTQQRNGTIAAQSITVGGGLGGFGGFRGGFGGGGRGGGATGFGRGG